MHKISSATLPLRKPKGAKVSANSLGRTKTPDNPAVLANKVSKIGASLVVGRERVTPIGVTVSDSFPGVFPANSADSDTLLGQSIDFVIE